MSSNLTFPVLAGQGWNTMKTPIWNTKIQTAVSGRELRASYYSSCRWKFSVTFDVLRAASASQDLQVLMGFFNQMKGSWDDFFYVDPTDFAASAEIFGTGDGVTTAFPITRSFNGVPGTVLVNGLFSVSVNGSSAPFTSASGIQTTIVTFTTAPAVGAVLRWTGNFHFRCRFSNDHADFDNIMYQLWTLKKLEFISIK